MSIGTIAWRLSYLARGGSDMEIGSLKAH
jgi:hypothetical protein